jgi:hypothetical protein
MIGKAKALGLGVLVAMAVSAVATVGASAEYSGHFVTEVMSTTVTGSETATHRSRFTVGGGTVECTNASYKGTIQGETVIGFTIAPKYESCFTQGTATHNVTITPNECTYTLKSTEKVHATFLIFCGDKPIEIHHPNCTMNIPPQEEPRSGVSYTTLLESGKHALTATFTVEKLEVEYEGGVCIFLGTNQTGSLKGSITLKGTDEAGKPVHITNT